MMKITNVKRIVSILIITIIISSTFFLAKVCQRYIETEKQCVLMSGIERDAILKRQRQIHSMLIRQGEEQREVNLMLEKQIKANLMLIKQREEMPKK